MFPSACPQQYLSSMTGLIRLSSHCKPQVFCLFGKKVVWLGAQMKEGICTCNFSHIDFQGVLFSASTPHSCSQIYLMYKILNLCTILWLPFIMAYILTLPYLLNYLPHIHLCYFLLAMVSFLIFFILMCL